MFMCSIDSVKLFLVISLYLKFIRSLIVNQTILKCQNDRQIIFINRTIQTLKYMSEHQSAFCELLLIKSDLVHETNITISLKLSKTYPNCNNFAFIFDGGSVFDPLMGIYDGKNSQDIFSSTFDKLLILFYNNPNSDEIFIKFAANKCPTSCSNHGSCIFNECLCESDYSGFDCSIKRPCRSGSCNFLLENTERFHVKLSSKSDEFCARAAHTASYVKSVDALYVFGGYNYNTILSHLQIYDFSTNKWTYYEQESNCQNKNTTTKLKQIYVKKLEDNQTKDSTYFSKPRSRYHHASCSFSDSFVIFGGKLDNGSIVNDLWLFNVTTKQWSLRATDSKINPPAVMMHSLLCFNNGTIVLFGGIEQFSKYNWDLFTITLHKTIDFEQWAIIKAKNKVHRNIGIFGAACVYYNKTNSLIVFGGYNTKGVPNKKMYSFQLNFFVWSEILYKSNKLYLNFDFKGIVFHTANIIGDYLVVYGGYFINKNMLLSPPIFLLYNLECNIWLSNDIIENFTSYDNLNVVNHASAVRSENMLLIVGGMVTEIIHDFHAFIFPDLFLKSTKKDAKKEICSFYKIYKSCISDIKCGWCTSNEKCYEKISESNCSIKLVTMKCNSLCETLNNCHSCMAYGNVLSNDKKNLCIWCSVNGNCVSNENYYKKCAYHELSELTNISKISECKQSQKRGLTLIEYNYPVDYSQPDKVVIINSTKIEIDIRKFYYDEIIKLMGEKIIIKILGTILLPITTSNLRYIQACSDYHFILRLTRERNDSYAEEYVNEFLNYSPTNSKICTSPINVPFINENLNIEIESEIVIDSNMHLKPITIELTQNALRNRYQGQILDFNYLKPYSKGDCYHYQNCLQCLTDAKCAWCSLNNQCFFRIDDEQIFCKIEKSDNDDAWEYFIIEAKFCELCSHLYTCQNCLIANKCEWKAIEKRCQRKTENASSNSIQSIFQCPLTCEKIHQPILCESNVLCKWFEITQQCLFYRRNMFQCNAEIITLSVENFMGSSHLSMLPFQNVINSPNCYKHENCSTCIQNLGCGWCNDNTTPLYGECVQGEFTHPYVSCDVTLNTSNVTWYFDVCPIVDKCLLNIIDCHPEAICINVNSSYVCQCKTGFYGNGVDYCMRTCNDICQNGVCSGYPNYECTCELGWTGSDCSVDCGCNFHSTCTQGVGICDLCQDLTTGKFCDKCSTGTYRIFVDYTNNGKELYGCNYCMCNGHGDIDKGICDSETGRCFCSGHTEGFHCENCQSDFIGNPISGYSCYYKCKPKAILNSKDIRGFGFSLANSENYGNECLWIIQPKINSSFAIRVSIKSHQASSFQCDNVIYFFDGYIDFFNNFSNSSLIGFLCSNSRFHNVQFISETGILIIYYRYRGLKDRFIATYDIIDDPYKDCKSKSACIITQLPCENNCSNIGYCNTEYGTCICPSSRTGSDCSQLKSDYSIVISEIFNSTKLHPKRNNNLRKILPRFGHSLISDNYENLWLFGGYSLSKGPLNDLMYFDTENYTWVTIDFSETDGKQPKSRYFHASEISLDDDLLFVYGGLGIFDSSPKIRTLDDFWQFDLKTYQWTQIKLKERPPSLAGHSLTYCQKFNSQFLMLIGGISSRTGFMRHVWQYDIKNKIWTQVETHGSIPQGIFSHSAVFRLKHLYISGGYELQSNDIENPNNIYMFNIETYHWIKLTRNYISTKPKFNSYNFLTTVATNDYFLIYNPYTTKDQKGHILIFLFKCYRIIPLINKYYTEVDKLPNDLYIQAMTINSEKNRIYIFGGSIATLEMKLYRIELPNDFCYLFSQKINQCLQMPGCSFCSMKINNSLINNYCYSSQKSSLDYCNGKQQHYIINYNDKICDENFEMNKNCTEFDNCATCLLNKNCQWCDTCSGYCIPLKKSCLITSNSIKSIFNCPRKKCLASNCYQCNLQKGCTWKENFNMFEIHDCMEISKNIKLQTVDKCVEKNILNSLLLKNTASDICYENDCSTYINCESCVKTSQCFWSLRLNSCLSNHMKPLYCAGGLCGLNLKGNDDIKNCPLSCHLMEKCSDCLKISHCGWCANHKVAHEGFCVDGSIDKLTSAMDTCETYFNKSFTTTKLQISSNFTWNFIKCPPENECINSHHNCSKKSEVCIDLDDGFLCQCSPGYNRINKNCVPNCENSCIHGNCIEPNICQCHFGYTGERCQFQCNCNGNSDCPSPDQLDVCIKCHNNTSGNQCQYCQPGYIRVLNKSLRCITCFEYCNGHSITCEGHEYVSFEEILSHNMNYGIKCTNCLNNTSGEQCETCIPGTFRGSTNLRNACTPCLCQGHGDRCNPITGSDCNCKNNTENKMLPNYLVNSLPFWILQCGKCKDTYYGQPFEGHQCYKQMIPYIKMCFDNKFLDECEWHTKPLNPGEVSFFNIQPRFINMDVRITIDVTFGTLNVYLSTLDLFVVTPNSSIGSYNIDIDKNIVASYFGNENIEQSAIVQKSSANESINYFKLKRNMSCFIVNNLRGRLVIILPMDLINFSYTKFFIILQAVPFLSEATSGIIYFGQDLNNVDTTIFISSFLSFFFLIFAISILIRKIRQISHSRTAARIQVIQLRQLSKRPYANISLKMNNNDISSDIISPVAIEPTENTEAAIINCILSLPSEVELNVPDNDYVTKIVLGSSLICVTSDTSVRQLLNKYEINN